MKILQFPLTKVTIWFVTGILVSYYTKPCPDSILTFLLLTFILFSISYYLALKKKKEFGFGFGVALLTFFIGIATWTFHDDTNRSNHYLKLCGNPEKEYTFQVTLTEKLKSSIYKDRYIGNVLAVNNIGSSGKILLNIQKDSKTPYLDIGNQLTVRTKLSRNRPPNNPDQFDYGKYLANKSIAAQLYANLSDSKKSPEINRIPSYYAAKLRTRIIQNLTAKQFPKTELNLVVALILGQQQEVSAEILHDYQFAGAVHVLSVSGLHIGFIVLFLNAVLKKFPKTKKHNLFRLLIILISLWGFALIAGLSPSVIRSVTMFSFVAIGLFLKRETNIFHTLLVSLLLILFFEPSFLFDVGFQLSYVSLFFILWLQPLFSKIWQPKSKLLKYPWDILTVSFAAQIGALPLSIYYFHQFPGLFFITNLVILPGLGIIMALGVLVVVLAAFNYVPEFTLYLLEKSLHLLNSIINWIASFEQFVIQDIPLNSYMLFSLYLVIIAVFVGIKKPTFNRLALAIATLFIFQATLFANKWQLETSEEWIVFHLPKESLIVKRNGTSITTYTREKTNINSKTNSKLKPYLIANFSHLTAQKNITNVFYENKNKILILDSMTVFPTEIQPDILIMTQSPKLNLNRFLQLNHPKSIVADGSNYKSYVSRWKETCRKAKIPFHATAEKGFYKLE